MDNILAKVTQAMLRKNIPQFKPGDNMRVVFKIEEGDSQRTQAYEGIVIARAGSGISETFTIRKVSYGIGVEVTFPIHSPCIEKMELVKSGKVRRAKLYYLRKKIGKKAKIKEEKI